MSLLEEYKDLDKERLAAGKKSREHYKSLNLPGVRNKKADAESAKKRIAAMQEERKKANQG